MFHKLVVFRFFLRDFFLPVEMDDLQDTTMLLGISRSLWWWTWHVMLQCGVPSWAFWETNGAAANKIGRFDAEVKLQKIGFWHLWLSWVLFRLYRFGILSECWVTNTEIIAVAGRTCLCFTCRISWIMPWESFGRFLWRTMPDSRTCRTLHLCPFAPARYALKGGYLCMMVCILSDKRRGK